jgi:hypothetical protein
MKRSFVIQLSGLFLLLGMVLYTPLAADLQQEQQPIEEEVTVTNIEVPVRVLYKGKPVGDLTKSDFAIYENKKKMAINGFFVKRRKIKIDPPEVNRTDIGKTLLQPRMFVLVFNVTSYNTYFQEAVDYLFDHILHPTDHVIIFANNTVRQYPTLENSPQIKQQVIRDLKEESKDAKRRLLDYIVKLERFINSNIEKEDFRTYLTLDSGYPEYKGYGLVKFLKKYLMAWNEYKRDYLTPRLDQFYYFAHFLEKVKAEKYVLNFYQFEFFPKIRLGSNTMQKIEEVSNALSSSASGVLVSQGHLINNITNQLMNDYNLEKGFPNEEISKLFYKVDATFHSFFIRATNPTTLDDFEYRAIASDLEKVLKSITDITGGRSITSNKLASSLETVSEIEDVYYILTYAPESPGKTGKLKIKVNNRKYDVLYDDRFRADYIAEYLQKLEDKIKTPDIKIDNFSFDKKILAFTVKDYLVKQVDEKSLAQLKVRIRLRDENNKSLFDQEKTLTARKDELNISLNTFKGIKKGEYDFFIDTQDLLTGKENKFHEKVTVSN